MFDGFFLKINFFSLLVRLPKNLKLVVVCAQDGTQNVPFYHFGSVLIDISYKTYFFVVKVICIFNFLKRKLAIKNIMSIKNRYKLKNYCVYLM